jgi:ethanolamine ammonia-lyase small subunit
MGEQVMGELWARLAADNPGADRAGPRRARRCRWAKCWISSSPMPGARCRPCRSRDTAALAAELAPLPVLQVASDAPDRATYLRRPDLGRRLSEQSAALLAETGGRHDVVFVIGDGLSATGVQAGAARLLKACSAQLGDLTIGPVVVATQARVALGDPIGAALGAAGLGDDHRRAARPQRP